MPGKGGCAGWLQATHGCCGGVATEFSPATPLCTCSSCLQVREEQVDGRYKVFRNLPASPALQFTAVGSTSDGSAGGDKGSAGGSGAVQLQALAPSGADGFTARGIMFLAPDPSSPSDSACGMLAINGEEAWEALQTEEDHQVFLARQFPALPPEWLPKVRG